MTAAIAEVGREKRGWVRELFGGRTANNGHKAGFGRRVIGVMIAPVRFLVVPCLVGLASGYVRGETTDQMVAGLMSRGAESLAIWLGAAYVHPTIAWALVRCLQFGLWALALLIVAALFARIHGLAAYLVISEIARRQGRRASAVDLFAGLSLVLAAAVALARYDEISLLAWIWFCAAYVYVRLAYDPPKVDRFLDWIVRLRGTLENGGDAPNGD